MSISYDQIFKDSQRIIETYGTRNPRDILEGRNVKIIPFSTDTKILGMFKIIKRNSFVFYNPYVDKRIQNMVFAHELGHEIYHKNMAKNSNLMEYELFDINSEMELEANIFACHLLINEDELLEDLKQGYTYNQLASLYNVNVNLMIFKLNEMHRMGLPIKKENPADSKFFNNLEKGYYYW